MVVNCNMSVRLQCLRKPGVCVQGWVTCHQSRELRHVQSRPCVRQSLILCSNSCIVRGFELLLGLAVTHMPYMLGKWNSQPVVFWLTMQ